MWKGLTLSPLAGPSVSCRLSLIRLLGVLESQQSGIQPGQVSSSSTKPFMLWPSYLHNIYCYPSCNNVENTWLFNLHIYPLTLVLWDHVLYSLFIFHDHPYPTWNITFLLSKGLKTPGWCLQIAKTFYQKNYHFFCSSDVHYLKYPGLETMEKRGQNGISQRILVLNLGSHLKYVDMKATWTV